MAAKHSGQQDVASLAVSANNSLKPKHFCRHFAPILTIFALKFFDIL